MTLFPRFEDEPANAANSAKASTPARKVDPSVSNFRDFSSPPSPEVQGSRSRSNNVSQIIDDIRYAYHERMAICLEGGDVSEAEAELIAEAEIGRLFVEAFVRGEKEY